MAELVPGGNQPLPDGTLTIRVPGPFDLSALITGDDGKVAGDADFVFFNQPTAPGTRVEGDTITVRPGQLRPGASRVTVVVSPADPGTPLGRLPAPVMSVTGSGGGAPLARFAPPRPGAETVLLLAEIYRRGTRWKVRAIGQGYADGLAGVARDFGVDVADDGTAEHPPAPPPPAPGDDGFLGLVNAARSRHGVPPVTLDPRLTRAAEAHAAAMAAHGALGAEGPDGTSLFHRIAAHGYAPLTVAEHLVSGPRTPDAFIDYCLSGEERRGPLRDPAVTHVGIGRASGAGDVFWTAVWAQPFTPDGLRRFTSEVITLTNAERAAARLAPLAPDPRLTAAAQAHSDDMVARDFYDHTSPEGRQPWDRAATAGATHRGIGENIACGQRGPAEVVRGWMNSPGHRANILKPDFTHIGVGYATGSRAGTYWTQVFGASR
ncbi:CAP domain-containing protein [Streptomyces sp. RTd22]|uniref:CAP domain-containing protein n=1 Tax=Streptomyces sp. RTd22 TaxID=1841249 RepID=UPI0007C44515|nr:CAP domain-containing protein [Streptomyces sp. RTd22]